MGKIKSLKILLGVFTVAVLFQNCGQVEMQNGPELSSKAQTCEGKDCQSPELPVEKGLESFRVTIEKHPHALRGFKYITEITAVHNKELKEWKLVKTQVTSGQKRDCKTVYKVPEDHIRQLLKYIQEARIEVLKEQTVSVADASSYNLFKNHIENKKAQPISLGLFYTKEGERYTEDLSLLDFTKFLDQSKKFITKDECKICVMPKPKPPVRQKLESFTLKLTHFPYVSPQEKVLTQITAVHNKRLGEWKIMKTVGKSKRSIEVFETVYKIKDFKMKSFLLRLERLKVKRVTRPLRVVGAS